LAIWAFSLSASVLLINPKAMLALGAREVDHGPSPGVIRQHISTRPQYYPDHARLASSTEVLKRTSVALRYRTGSDVTAASHPPNLDLPNGNLADSVSPVSR
jgi:hypothetical protein